MNKASELTPDWPAPATVRACITTRRGGESPEPYAGFNLASHVGEASTSIMANRERLMQRQQLENIQWLAQIHGTDVVEAAANGRTATADGCVTRQKNLACAVLTADCLPVLLCDRRGTQVAALHAGWRGLAAGILAKGIEKFSARPAELLAYLGPAISQPHFEVGGEVLEAFLAAARNVEQAEAVQRAFVPAAERPLKFYGDLYALARAELKALGVNAVYGGDYCTFADSERFYSYRRDGKTGRMASLIWLV